MHRQPFTLKALHPSALSETAHRLARNARDDKQLKRPFQFSLRTLLLLVLPIAIVSLFMRWMNQLEVLGILLFVGGIGVCIGLAQSLCAELLLLALRDDRTTPCFRGEFVRSTVYSSCFIGLVGILVAGLILMLNYFIRLGFAISFD
jgi:hypothetical protein